MFQWLLAAKPTNYHFPVKGKFLKKKVFILQDLELCGLLTFPKWIWISTASFTKLVPFPLLELGILVNILLHHTLLLFCIFNFSPFTGPFCDSLHRHLSKIQTCSCHFDILSLSSIQPSPLTGHLTLILPLPQPNFVCPTS